MLPVTALHNLYYSMIHPHIPHLFYGIDTWGNAPEKHFKKLKILPNKVIKLLTGVLWRDHAA